MSSYTIQISNYGQRKSVSMDSFLFDLLSAHLYGKGFADQKIREIGLDNWGQPMLSNLVQREVLKLICRPLILEEVLKTDFYNQADLDL